MYKHIYIVTLTILFVCFLARMYLSFVPINYLILTHQKDVYLDILVYILYIWIPVHSQVFYIIDIHILGIQITEIT